MATYAIGDVQGCYEPLTRLLDRIQYRRGYDRVYLVGDLVNRGPASLETLRFAVTEDLSAVLGNHDLYALARAFDLVQPTADDTLGPLFTAPDRDQLIAWLLARPIMAEAAGALLVHAGLLPAWTVDQALIEARHIEAHLAADPRALIARYFQRPRPSWSPGLTGLDRAAAALAAFVRIRFVDGEGQPIAGATSPEQPPSPDARPWFAYGPPRGRRVVFGHWAALGLWLDQHIAAIDTGCVWGHSLTALNLETRHVWSVSAR